MGERRGRRAAALAVSLTVLGLVAASLVAPQDGKPETGVSQPKAPKEARKQWEYKQVSTCPGGDDIEDKLNEQGERGWELVTLAAKPPSVRPECYLATFKRERVR